MRYTGAICDRYRITVKIAYENNEYVFAMNFHVTYSYLVTLHSKKFSSYDTKIDNNFTFYLFTNDI